MNPTKTGIKVRCFVRVPVLASLTAPVVLFRLQYILCVLLWLLSNCQILIQYSKHDVGGNLHLVLFCTDFISITVDVYIVAPEKSVCINLKSGKLYKSNEANTPRTGIYHILI